MIMDILILGGTVFLGRALVDAARARGHRLTLFNRGKSNPGLYPEVESLHGDRAADLGALSGRRWDAVIDTCGYLPRVVRASAEALAGQVEHYTFISSLSVYANVSRPGMDESGVVGKLADESVETIDGETYGPLKALCEQAVERALPGRALVIRPGLIVGPFDPLDRFTYWPARVAQGGEVLAPGLPETPVQVIDVRDLAEWTVAMVESRATGTFNATGPQPELSMGRLLETCRSVSGSDAALTWVDEAFLLAQGVQPWSDLPVWIPVSDASSAGSHRFDCRKAITAGLRFRPIAETVRATLDWEAARPPDHPWRAGITRQRERELLELWKNQAINGLG
jgi:2'-hydroxyisoflavone reductase